MPNRNPNQAAAKPLSVMLREVSEQAGDHVSMGDLVEHFGRRAFGAVLFLFAILNLFPWPPGGTTITGAPLLLISLQVAWGRRTVWLPRALLGRGVEAAAFRKGLDKLLPWLERVEKVSRPRLSFLFGPVGDRVLGGVCVLLALVIVLPIFGGNFLPAVAASFLALSLVQRDGLLALAGYLGAVVSAAVLVLVAGMIVQGLQYALEWLGRVAG